MKVIDAINHAIWILGGIGAIVAVVCWLMRRINPAGNGRR
jgi:hypothetical protein